MEDVVETVKRLIALAVSSTTEAESRTAAHAACSLIVRHNLILTLPAENRGVTFPSPRVRPPAPQKARVVPDDGEWKQIKSKYRGICKWCRKSIKPNSTIYWSKLEGAYHKACFLNSEG